MLSPAGTASVALMSQEPTTASVFSYIPVHSGGFAPNPDGGALTLATCKPDIRKAAQEVEDVDEPFDEKMKRLTARFRDLFAEGARLEKAIPKNLAGLGYGG